MPSTFDLFTLNYPAMRPQMGVPVQASNGKPRYVASLKYDLQYAAREVYPPWAIVRSRSITHAGFREAYHAHLAAVGVDQIESRFRGIARAADDRRLVLLCFEDIAKSEGNWCHRNMFAEWWTATTGQPVRELGPVPDYTRTGQDDDTGPAPAPQPPLF